MLIPAAHIEPALKATDRYGAISELLHILVHVGAIPRGAESTLFTAFRHREEAMSTGVGFGIAVPTVYLADRGGIGFGMVVPHVYLPGVTEPVAAFGRSLAGVDFAGLDSVPVELILLSIVPADDATRHSYMKLFSRMARGLNLPRTRNALRQCVTAQEIESILDGF